MYKIAIIVVVFVLGLYVFMKYDGVEGFANKLHARCPDILIQKGSAFFLYNSKLAKVPGVNPLRFNHLDDYVEFIDWQRSQGIRCPVLYLQESYDAQGNAVYKARPSPTNLQGGLPDKILQDDGLSDTIVESPVVPLTDAGRQDPPYNQNNYPGFDGQDQNVGSITPLDKMFNEKKGVVSPNPMDDSWGGVGYTQSLIDAGYYKDDEVSIYVP